jgi:hypothetical protein
MKILTIFFLLLHIRTVYMFSTPVRNEQVLPLAPSPWIKVKRKQRSYVEFEGVLDKQVRRTLKFAEYDAVKLQKRFDQVAARVITAAGVLDDGVIDQNADVVTDIQDFPISTLPEWDQPTLAAFVDVEDDLIETVPAHFSLECQHFEQQFEPSSSSSTFEQFEPSSSSNLGSFTQVFSDLVENLQKGNAHELALELSSRLGGS